MIDEALNPTPSRRRQTQLGDWWFRNPVDAGQESSLVLALRSPKNKSCCQETSKRKRDCYDASPDSFHPSIFCPLAGFSHSGGKLSWIPKWSIPPSPSSGLHCNLVLHRSLFSLLHFYFCMHDDTRMNYPCCCVAHDHLRPNKWTLDTKIPFVDQQLTWSREYLGDLKLYVVFDLVC